MKTYPSGKAYRIALEHNIDKIAESDDVGHNKLRKHAIFDVVLSRVERSGSGFVLKGGYALMLRVPHFRHTKDMDFVVRRHGEMSAELAEELGESVRGCLIDALREQVGDDTDYFAFIVDSGWRNIIDGDGYRFNIKVLLDGRRFETFHTDVILMHEDEENTEFVDYRSKVLSATSDLAVEVTTKARHFSEKIHAYTEVREFPNSRSKDLVDMILLIRLGLDEDECRKSLTKVFMERGKTEVPITLLPPPPVWEKDFSEDAKDSMLDTSLEEAFEELKRFYCRLF